MGILGFAVAFVATTWGISSLVTGGSALVVSIGLIVTVPVFIALVAVFHVLQRKLQEIAADV